MAYRKPHTIAMAAHVANLPGLDVLSGARYIVAEPSIVRSRQYRWERHPLDRTRRGCRRSPSACASACRLHPHRTQHTMTSAPARPAKRRNHCTVLEHALAHLNPWAGGYGWWVSILMALGQRLPWP